MSSKQSLSDPSKRHVLISRCCIALVLQKIHSDATKQPEDGHCIFADFLQQNSMCFWNACLTRSVASLEYRGCLVPSTLLISGTDFALEVVRSAWARRVLRPPKGYSIGRLGDIGVVEMVPVSQTQFAPLSEALCKVVADLNGDGVQASTSTIRVKLEENFPEMQVPAEDILYKTLGGLIKERKLYHTGNGYFVVSPETYRQRAVSPLCERQMLMTNEEAIVKLHGRKECSLAIQVDEMDIAAAWKCSSSAFLHASQRSKDVSCQITQVPPSPDLQYLERSHSLKILRMKRRPKSNEGVDRGGSFKETKRLSYLANELNENIQDLPKSEKQSVLAKILKRMQSLTDKSAKHVSFSAQFPPLEWLENGHLHGHSVATQTLLQKVDPKANVKRIEPSCPKIPWDEVDGRGFTYYFTSNGVPKSTFVDTDSNKYKNASVPMRQGNSRHSPSHRYSHGSFSNYAKRRHRHRRSSSESPKIHKTLSNGHRNSSPGSKSPTDQSDAKLSFSSSSGSANPKAIVNPRLQTLEHPHGPRTNLYSSNTLPSNWESRNNASPLRAPETKQIKNSSTYSPKTIKRIPVITNSPKCVAESKLDKELRTYSPKMPRSIQSVNVPKVLPTQNQMKGKDSKDKSNLRNNQESEEDHSLSRTLNDAKLALSESFSDTSVSCNGVEPLKKSIDIKPLVLKSFVDEPKVTQKAEKKPSPPKEITVDNSVSVEVALEKSPQPSNKKNNISTTVVTEETTVTKENGNSKVVTVTSITTSLSHGGIKDLEKPSPDKSSLDSVTSEKQKTSVNDLNIETVKGSRIIDCSSSCNIVTEVK
ncbi:Storkhead-box protein 1 like protein [Argiope bruennichi]|uniref:Storkhead-box protein 1 like protein n=1 Tax=Argiope bruennichi TaxID=94029 RepID=A0A8T0G560_ARGBR|nr:Storkhead-box protein 1 like protein [Argiope bruennichi]